MWRTVADRVRAAEFPDVPLDHLLVDNAAMQLLVRPSDFDVIVTENTFGDILSDEAAVLVGSIGLLPSASLGADGTPGLFEPVHGSAPDITGTGMANPLGMFLCAALMLRFGLGLEAEADALERAVSASIDDGLRTADLGGSATTREATDAVLAHL
jgi:3-isopropylmalate dehydrogenase